MPIIRIWLASKVAWCQWLLLRPSKVQIKGRWDCLGEAKAKEEKLFGTRLALPLSCKLTKPLTSWKLTKSLTSWSDNHFWSARLGNLSSSPLLLTNHHTLDVPAKFWLGFYLHPCLLACWLLQPYLGETAFQSSNLKCEHPLAWLPKNDSYEALFSWISSYSIWTLSVSKLCSVKLVIWCGETSYVVNLGCLAGQTDIAQYKGSEDELHDQATFLYYGHGHGEVKLY